MSSRSARRLCTLALLLLAPLAGCGSQPAVSGTVTYKKELLTTGEVSFIAADGKSRSGLIGSDGRYEVIDPPMGDVTIVVVAKKAEGKAGKNNPLAGNPASGGSATLRSLIPARYGDPRTSGLTFRVTGGRQTKDIDLGDD